MLFFKKKNIIALDIGSSSVKLVALKKVKRGYYLTNLGIMPLPPETIVERSIMNSTAIVDAILELISKCKIKTKHIATSISGNAVNIKKITLPVMNYEQLQESIQWEVEQLIPYDISEVNMDVNILRSDEKEDGQMDVVLVAVKSEIINEYIETISEAGLLPTIMDVDCFAIQNMFEFNYGKKDNETIVLANIGASITNINIIDKGVSIFTRDISVGGNLYTNEIQKQLNISFEEAEELKVGGNVGSMNEISDQALPQEVGSILRQISEQIATEIQRTIDFVASSSGGVINKIYISGGVSKMVGLVDVIKGKTKIETEVINPLKNVKFDEKRFDPVFLENQAPSVSLAIGLAMRRLGDKHDKN